MFWIQHKNKIMIGGGIIVLILAFYFMRKKFKPKDKLGEMLGMEGEKSVEDKPAKSEAELKKEAENSTKFPLKIGSENKHVAQLQRWLKVEKGQSLDKFGVDGVFGHETQTALKNATHRDSVSKDYFIKTKMYNY